MGIFDFIVNAGKALTGGKPAEPAVRGQADPELQKKLNDQRITGELLAEVNRLGLGADNLNINFSNGVVKVVGQTATQANREKLILALGNIAGVAKVDENIEVVQKDPEKPPEPEAIFYTVVKGDTLSKIAKAQYGDAQKYNVIFEANKPMLSNPDKIYPGQVLRIPPLK